MESITPTVPALSILFMTLSALAAIGTPIGLFIFWRVKYRAKILPLLLGVTGFILFALILEQMVHIIVLRPDAAGNIALKSKPFFFVLYGILMAGIFEETARFIFFNILRKKHRGIETALSYGVGHGGIEAILLVGVSMISNIVISMSINSGAIEAMKSGLGGAALTQLNAQIEALLTTAPYMFLIAGEERLAAIAIQIALSVIVFYSVRQRDKWWLFPAAIALHAIIDIPAAMMQAGVLHNIFAVEGFVGLGAILLVVLAVYVHKKLRPSATL